MLTQENVQKVLRALNEKIPTRLDALAEKTGLTKTALLEARRYLGARKLIQEDSILINSRWGIEIYRTGGRGQPTKPVSPLGRYEALKKEHNDLCAKPTQPASVSALEDRVTALEKKINGGRAVFRFSLE